MPHAIDESANGQSILVTATRVPDDQRMQFLPRFFGRNANMLIGESLVYNALSNLSPDYDGGYWVFYELSNGGYYMAPDLDCETIRICCADNWFDGEMSPDAAGIVATLFALNTLAWKNQSSRMVELFDLLRDFAGDHAEGPAIFAAID